MSLVKSRRGVTLAELLVSIALVAIVIVMVVSFALMLSERTKASEDNLLFQQDYSMVKTGVEVWMSQVTDVVTAEGGTEGQIDAVMLKSGDTTLQFKNGVLDGSEIAARMEHIGSVTFMLVENADHEYLLFCKVTKAESNESYIFSVNPRVGEKVQMGGTP